MTKTRIEEIYENVLPEMERLGIEDTTANRLTFLQGLYDAWNEDEEVNFEKTMYMVALHAEIMSLQLRVKFPTVFG